MNPAPGHRSARSGAFRRSPVAVCRFHHGPPWRTMLFSCLCGKPLAPGDTPWQPRTRCDTERPGKTRVWLTSLAPELEQDHENNIPGSDVERRYGVSLDAGLRRSSQTRSAAELRTATITTTQVKCNDGTEGSVVDQDKEKDVCARALGGERVCNSSWNVQRAAEHACR